MENMNLDNLDLTDLLLQKMFQLFKMLIEVDLSFNFIENADFRFGNQLNVLKLQGNLIGDAQLQILL